MLSFLALSTIEIVALIGFLIFLIVGAGYDRRGRHGVKWLAIAGAIVVWLCFQDWSEGAAHVFAGLVRPSFWLPVLGYLTIGLLVYSPIEFRMEIRGSARRMRERWEDFLAKNPRVRAKKLTPPGEFEAAEAAAKKKAEEDENTIFEKAKEIVRQVGWKNSEVDWDALKPQARKRREEEKEPEALVSEFVNHANSRYYGYVSDIIRLKANGLDIDTEIHRPGLVQSIACWTFLWPFYAVSLVIGDLVLEFFETVVDFTQKWANERLKKAFDGVFSVK